MSTTKDEKKAAAAADAGGIMDDAPRGRGLGVIFSPIQAPTLRSTEKNDVFQFLKKYDQYLEIICDRRLAGEHTLPVELIRCLAPGLYAFLKDYVLEDTQVEVEDQVIRGQHSSAEVRAYLESLIYNNQETITVEDVLRGISWNLTTIDPQARVIAVFKAVHERMLKHGLTPDNFCEKSLIQGIGNLIRPLPLRDAILTQLNMPSNKALRKDRKLFFKLVLSKTITFEEFNTKPTRVSKDGMQKSKPVPKNYKCYKCNNGCLPKHWQHECPMTASSASTLKNNGRWRAPPTTVSKNISGVDTKKQPSRFSSSIAKPKAESIWRRDASGKRLQRVPSPARPTGRARSLTNNSSGALPAILGKVYSCDVIVDSGASRSVIPLNVLEKILTEVPDICINNLASPLEFVLADGSVIESYQKALVDVAIQLNHGSVNINKVQFYILPSSSDEVLLGTPAQRRLGLPDFTDVLEDMARNNEHATDLPANAIVEEGQEQLRRLLRIRVATVDANHSLDTTPLLPKDLPRFSTRSTTAEDSADILDQEDHEGVVGDPAIDQAAAIDEAIEDMLGRAAINGASADTVRALRAVVLDHKNVWRVKLGADPPADVPPLKIQLVDGAKLPKSHAARRFSPLQQAFVNEHVAMLLRAGVATVSSSDCASGIVLVRKPDGTWRLCVDLRRINKLTKRDLGPLPRVEDLLTWLAGAKCFASLDMIKGYWQFPVELLSQRFLAFVTSQGTFQFTRVVMGARNSAAHFQQVMQTILDGLLFAGVLLYLDDILLYGEREDDLVRKLDLVLTRLDARGIKLQPRKCDLFARSLTWVGHKISADGVEIDPAWLQTTLSIPEPVDAAQLQQFLAACNWVRGKIPNYATIVAPLQQLLQTALKGLRKRNKESARRVTLVSVGWGDEHSKCFSDIKTALTDAVRLAHPREDYVLCLFTDASTNHWASMLTQIPMSDFLDQHLPVDEWRHEPLAFLSGSFNGSSTNWAIPDKEAFAIYQSCRRLAHFLVREEGFHIFTDHRNLLYIFHPAGVVDTVCKPTADRLERWAVFLRAFDYTIQHLEGDANVWADLLSRWGAGTAAATAARERLASVRMQLLPHRVVPAINSAVPPEEAWPSLREIAITPISRATREKFRLIPREDGCWVTPRGCVFVQSASIQQRLLIVAHAGAAGHRGIRPTIRQLEQRFFWESLRRDVQTFVRGCLLCMKTRGGGIIPRHLLHQQYALQPRKMLHFDFCKLAPGLQDYGYVLVLKDDFSTFTWLWPCRDQTALSAAEGILHWSATFGIPSFWVSDQGTHFRNAVIQEVQHRLRAEHHFISVYSPWANGAVERVNRELVRLMRTLLAEECLTPASWPSVLLLAQATINNTPAEVRLAGQTPSQVMFGMDQLQPLDSVLGLLTEDVLGSREAAEAVIRQHGVNLAALLQKRWADASEGRLSQVERTRRRDEARKVRDIDFDIGDYVLVYVTRQRNKLRVKWTGPFRVVDTINPAVYICENLVTGSRSPVHTSRLRKYADSLLNVTADLKEQVAHDALEFYPDKIVGWREADEGRLELKVRWLGFDASDDSWEPVAQFYEDAPTMVRRYAQRMRRTAPGLLELINNL